MSVRWRGARPRSRIEAAREYGIDLTLIMSQLRLTPEERVRVMHDASAIQSWCTRSIEP